MVFGLFGNNDEEVELRSSLSKEVFLAEFETAQATFGIVASSPDGYSKVEATAQFLFEQVMKAALEAHTLKTKKDMQAATMLCIVMVQCFGRNVGLSKGQLQLLLGKVPGFVYSRTLSAELKPLVGDSISKSIIRYVHKLRQKRFRHNV